MEIDEIAQPDRTTETPGQEPDEHTAGHLSADPIRAVVGEVQRITGDRLSTVARGIEVNERWLTSVMNGDVQEIDDEHARAVCAGMSCEPTDLWPQASLSEPSLEAESNQPAIDPEHEVESLWLKDTPDGGPVLNF